MPSYRPRHHELRDIHDWDNPLRPTIDGLEFIVLTGVTIFAFFYAIGPTYRDDDGKVHSVYSIFELFTHWRTLLHLVVGLLEAIS